jgi:hypothetical protein
MKAKGANGDEAVEKVANRTWARVSVKLGILLCDHHHGLAS